MIPSTRDTIAAGLAESASVKRALLDHHLTTIEKIGTVVATAMLQGGKLLLFGNGGSAADAQHIAAELVGRYHRHRDALPAIALHCNTSATSAIANDYGYDEVYARQVVGFGRKGDVAIGLSTSGNAPSVCRAIAEAKRMGLRTIGLTGATGGELVRIADISLVVPSTSTARIQEAHMTVGHILCALIEDAVCPDAPRMVGVGRSAEPERV
jgi:D-sedoheptulose 7-phosphate isomerase